MSCSKSFFTYTYIHNEKRIKIVAKQNIQNIRQYFTKQCHEIEKQKQLQCCYCSGFFTVIFPLPRWHPILNFDVIHLIHTVPNPAFGEIELAFVNLLQLYKLMLIEFEIFVEFYRYITYRWLFFPNYTVCRI